MVPAVVLDREPDDGVCEVEPVRAERVLDDGWRQSVTVDRDSNAELHRRPGAPVGQGHGAPQSGETPIARMGVNHVEHGLGCEPTVVGQSVQADDGLRAVRAPAELVGGADGCGQREPVQGRHLRAGRSEAKNAQAGTGTNLAPGHRHLGGSIPGRTRGAV
jgi:hypothetical protein